MNKSLNRSEIVTIKVGEKSGTQQVTLPKGTCIGVAKFDNGNAPGFLRVGIDQSGVDIVKPIHHKTFEKSGGGRYIDQYKQLFVEVAGTYNITATTDTAVAGTDYKFEMEFLIVDGEQIPFFKLEE